MDLSNLNKRQKQAVTSSARTLIVLAGPGSGKTRVLTHRIAWLIEQGVNPANILAVTFTNKAAREMKERVGQLLAGGTAQQVTTSTFHSFGARLLRSDIKTVGEILARNGGIATARDRRDYGITTEIVLGSNFSIYDESSRDKVLSEAIASLNLDKKRFPPSKVGRVISGWKNSGILPNDSALMEAAEESSQTAVWRAIYLAYQSRLLACNACDFDDLILYPVVLFESDTSALRRYRQRFSHVLIDEYQDTNGVQYRLSELLTGHTGGYLTVVGDEDQSIYRFRGADFTNVRRLMDSRPRHELVLLEQNYRSVRRIVQAANRLIGNNTQRVAKKMWTQLSEAGGGDVIRYVVAENGEDEAARIAAIIEEKINGGVSPADMAILYRTNSQSRLLEMGLVRAGVPYQMARGVGFYQRREVKDALAYLNFLYNGDVWSFRRIVNVPRRGIGGKTIEAIERAGGGDLKGWLLDFYNQGQLLGEHAPPAIWKKMAAARGLAAGGGAAQNVWKFAGVVHYLSRLPDPTPREITEAVIGILRESVIGEEERMENLLELLNLAEQVKGHGEAGLRALLDMVSLATNDEATDEDNTEKVTLTTLHGSKGAEWPIVFLAGAEAGYCPHQNVAVGDRDGQEEERRLFYVGVTRAKEELFIIHARNRLIFGDWKVRSPSPFIAEIKEHQHE